MDLASRHLGPKIGCILRLPVETMTSKEQLTLDSDRTATTHCMATSDLCRNIASYCDGVDLLRLEQVNYLWQSVAKNQFKLIIEYSDYKYLTLHRRHTLSSIKRACFRISSRRNKDQNALCLFGGAYDSSSKTMCSVLESRLPSNAADVTVKINQDLPRTLTCSACAADNDGNILILGGWDDLASGTIAAVRSFNTQGPVEDRRWTMLPPLCRPRCFGAAVALSTGDMLHMGGGSSLYVGGVCYADTFIRKANSADWEEKIVPSVLHARYGHSAFELFSGDILITGGYGGGSFFHRSVEMLTQNLDRWIELPEMSVPRSAMAAVLGPCGSIYVAGGTVDGTTGHKSAERYDPREGKWSPLASMHMRRGCTTGCLSVCKSGFYVLGGSSNWAYNQNMEFYDFRMNEWTLMQAAPEQGSLLGRAIPYLKLDI